MCARVLCVASLSVCPFLRLGLVGLVAGWQVLTYIHICIIYIHIYKLRTWACMQMSSDTRAHTYACMVEAFMNLNQEICINGNMPGLRAHTHTHGALNRPTQSFLLKLVKLKTNNNQLLKLKFALLAFVAVYRLWCCLIWKKYRIWKTRQKIKIVLRFI